MNRNSNTPPTHFYVDFKSGHANPNNHHSWEQILNKMG
jgi:hypothetical protein